jgi:hypothetical protein
MRQFFSWRLWAALAAIVVLALAWKTVAPGAGVTAVGPGGPKQRTVQLVSLVYSVIPSEGFSVATGTVVGSADLVLDGKRTMHVYPGTLGEIACPDYTAIGRCVVLADLLGEAVVWFALAPVQTGLKVFAPPIVELLPNSVARLANGWLVPHANTVARRCDHDTASLADFIRTQGPGSTTVIDVITQRISQVVCATASAEPTTTTIEQSPPSIDLSGSGDTTGDQTGAGTGNTDQPPSASTTVP